LISQESVEERERISRSRHPKDEGMRGRKTKMNVARVCAAVAALSFAVTGVVVSPGNDMKGTSSMNRTSDGMAENRSSIPPIDRRMPGKIETATFALG
jgi:hypothetical protein